MIDTVLSLLTLTQALGIAPDAVALGLREAWDALAGITAQPTIRPLPSSPPVATTLVFRNWRRERSCTVLMSGSLRGAVDGRADARVGAAAADVAGHRLVDVGVARVRLGLEQRHRAHDLARLAVAALRHVVGDPG